MMHESIPKSGLKQIQNAWCLNMISLILLPKVSSNEWKSYMNEHIKCVKKHI